MPTPEELTIPDKLDSINVTKQAIRQAITDKGVEVPEGTTFYEYAGKIAEIDGGGEAGSFRVNYGGFNSATFYFLGGDGVYQQLKNPVSIQLPYPSVFGIYVEPLNPRDPGGTGADFSSEEIEKLQAGSNGPMMAPSELYLCLTKNSSGSISVY